MVLMKLDLSFEVENKTALYTVSSIVHLSNPNSATN